MDPEVTTATGRQLPSVPLKDLPPLPQAAMYVLEVARKPGASADKVARALGSDQSIALRFLAVANSSYYSPVQPITTLPHCVSWLGLEFVCSTLIALSMDRLASKKAPKEFDRLAYWRHNLSLGTAMELLAGRVSYEQPGEAYLLGLVHDIGKQVLVLTHGEEYMECLRESAATGRPLQEVEDDLIGLDHSLAGAMALRDWQFNPGLIQIILEHHEPSFSGRGGQMRALLRLAHGLCNSLGVTGLGSDPTTTLPLALETLRLDEEMLIGAVSDLQVSLQNLDSIVETMTA